MNAIRNLWSACANLAASLNNLASIINGAAGRLEQQLALDHGDGRQVIDHVPPEVQVEEPAASNGRKRKASAI